MDPTDLKRYLEKWEDTLTWCRTHFMRSSEAAAAEHVNPTVFYSPICQRVNEALGDVKMIKAKLELDGVNANG